MKKIREGDDNFSVGEGWKMQEVFEILVKKMFLEKEKGFVESGMKYNGNERGGEEQLIM